MQAIAQPPSTIKCDRINLIGKEPRTKLPKREIKAKDFVNDIRSGMSDSQIRGKYNLSAQGLESAFKKLLEAKAVPDFGGLWPRVLGRRHRGNCHHAPFAVNELGVPCSNLLVRT